MADIELRSAVLADAAAIAEVVQRSRSEGFKDVLPESSLEEPLEGRVNLVTRDLVDEARSTIVAVAGPDIVGMCTYDAWMRDDPPGPEDVSEITDLYVDPAAWRSGVGRDLIEVTLDDLRQRGSREVVVVTFAKAERALAFYAAAGFIKEPRWQMVNFYNQQPMVRLRLSLGAEC
jgi:ribosomal protein S18 acetylase RimI-like enzyme